MGAKDPRSSTATAMDAANEPRVLAFDHLISAADCLTYLLERAIEREFGISHAMFEVLLLLARAQEPLPMREVSQARVLSTGGVTRLVDRMEKIGLVRRAVSAFDGRVRLVAMTAKGEEVMLLVTRTYVRNVQRYMLDVLPAGERDTVVRSLAALAVSARVALPRMP